MKCICCNNRLWITLTQEGNNLELEIRSKDRIGPNLTITPQQAKRLAADLVDSALTAEAQAKFDKENSLPTV